MVENWIATIEEQPAKFRTIAAHLTNDQLELTYRPDGWTIRQVVHHVADSHLNSFIRFKWTLTEDNPTIKAYHEDRWATLADYDKTPIEISLRLLESLHQRWVILLKSLSPADLQKTFIHPESGKTIQLDQLISLYAWHGNHHLAHIALALRK